MMDELDEFSGPVVNDPRFPEIPKVIVRREWPYFNDSADVESLQCVADDVDSLWRRLAEWNEPIDSPEFYGPTADYWLDGMDCPIDLYRDQLGDARIAIANYRHASTEWERLLGKPCWKGVSTYPPVNVLVVMMQEYFTGDIDAVQLLAFTQDNLRSIAILEERRKRGIETVAPTMAMFQASVWALGIERRYRRPKLERDDTPTSADIANGRRVLSEMSTRNPSVEGFRQACRKSGISGSNAKLGTILRALKDER